MLQPGNPYGQYQTSNSYNQIPRPRRHVGCLGWLVLLIMLGAMCWIAYAYLKNNPSSVLFLNEFFSSSMFIATGVIGIMIIIILTTLARATRGTALGKVMGWLSALMIWAGAFLVFLWIIFLNPHIEMTHTNFTTTYVTIFSHDKITIQNPANGITQTFCIGKDQQCDTLPDANYPSQLNKGLVIQPGQSVNLEFDHAGSYYITSKSTPHMNLKIVVTGTN